MSSQWNNCNLPQGVPTGTPCDQFCGGVEFAYFGCVATKDCTTDQFNSISQMYQNDCIIPNQSEAASIHMPRHNTGPRHSTHTLPHVPSNKHGQHMQPSQPTHKTSHMIHSKNQMVSGMGQTDPCAQYAGNPDLAWLYQWCEQGQLQTTFPKAIAASQQNRLHSQYHNSSAIASDDPCAGYCVDQNSPACRACDDGQLSSSLGATMQTRRQSHPGMHRTHQHPFGPDPLHHVVGSIM